MVQHDKQFLRVLAWGFLQLGILGIGASGCALWAHHPFPRESLALQEMLAGQALIIALLFPVLISSRLGLANVIALMLPMDELSGMMSNASQTSIWMGFGCVALWLAGLGGLGLLITQRYQVATVGLATLLTVGGGILDYLRWEAAATNGQTSVFLPIGMLPQLCRAIETPSAMPWIQAGMPTIALTVTLILRLSIPPRSGPSTSLHSLS